jgi:site-specific DNA-methyltransferase (adenine-specific)
MLNSRQLRNLVDFPDSGEAFPGVQIKGGVCYFLWEASHKGPCQVTQFAKGVEHVQSARELGEFDVFVRDERALGILRKVLDKKEESILSLVSGDTPFGIATNFRDWTDKRTVGHIPLHLIERGKRIVGFIKRDAIRKNANMLNCWKVLVPEAYGAGETVPHQILGKAIIASPPSACTQSYLVISQFASKNEAMNFSSYYRTRFFRFLVSLRKITQHALRSTYSWVPRQAWDHELTDEILYKKYGIEEEEIAFIESMIRPMNPDNGNDD